ncbi:MAG: murein DD-endopeptidase MepM/ murein hydrolase activator NlpD [Alphaproteobacteria bacterium]|jgi:murein DD-endopeptidase MepM/ murein hydrolase activator NlpD
MRYILSALFMFLPTIATAVELVGYPVQGGYLLGKTVPGAEVSLGVHQTIADPKGSFVLGIPRLQEKDSVLKIMLMEGIEEKHPLTIQQNTYKTQSIKGIKKKHVTPRSKVDLKQIKLDTKAIHAARAVVENLPFVYEDFTHPVSGTITGVYGSRRLYNGEERNWHKGVDFAAPRGTPIKAPASGIVRLALENSFFNGNLVIVDHGFQLMTIYAHMDSITVNVGQEVKVGEQLGTLGSTGRSTGPHLHWGLYWRNMALDPMLLFNKKTNLN